MFASKAGAKLVIGIDMSNILGEAEKIIEANGFKDSKSYGSLTAVPMLTKLPVCQRSFLSRESLKRLHCPSKRSTS
jgi:hypothetical protein